ncbi:MULTISPECIES: serine hydrolase domain-containing protein [Myroides]|uniref:Serine hydrolase n=1 Tax=Myroides odoratimimus TaxID=76832 RepID=A0AAI8G438_9FLAO|nr:MULTISPECIES: serine hydrolase [Myroides]ALU25318.1 serine hydrolase [Myroides odoratimimus]APA91323.1 serine hydrolase [Myroides sp. ZB35]MCA4806111.1 serine hydrolase [Myroides odoratimimus]MCO7723175.1 beta-lactamase family protein [Myroides odoratimimus]MCS7472063.1 beta-lactamase family protein [Myroides odoratimimus]
MKVLKKVLKWLVILIALVVALMYIFKVDYLFTAVRTIYFNGYKTAFLDDYKYFPTREIKNDVGQPWAFTKDYNTIKASDNLENTHKELESIAYLVIKNDSIFYEAYYDGYGKDSYTNSFSMAKSIVSAALGKALQRGEIKSLDQKVIEFLPELKGKYKDEVTVGDLSSMASGLDWDEAYYSPFSVVTRAYFDKDLRNVMLGLEIKDKPGQEFIYKSGDTELLTMVLEKATGKYMTDYISEYFWKPMGAENPALWQLDHEGDGVEKSYCCFTSNARDFARFGKLYKDEGLWNGDKILDSAFIRKSITPRFKDAPEYGYGWWLVNHKGQDFFYMRGHLGQFVIVSPKDNVIIVRLGHLKGLQTEEDPHSNDLYTYIDEAYNMLNQRK